MQVVVAAGGSGTRMAPASQFVNKHLLHCGNGDLMIDMPLRFLAEHNLREVSIVTGSNHATQICEYVGDGERHGLQRVEYFFQVSPNGIADILNRISHRDTEDGILLILGDNYFGSQQPSIYMMPLVDRAACWEYDLGDPVMARRFGQVLMNEHGDPQCIVEKPDNPVHGRILTGLYYFPGDVFKLVENMKPSSRGELEITDLLDAYLREGRLEVQRVHGRWADLGEWQTLDEFIVRRNAEANAKESRE